MSSHTCFLCLRSIHLAKRKSPSRRPPSLPAPSASATGTCGARPTGACPKLACGSNMRPADPRGAALLGALQRGTPGSGIGPAAPGIAPRARGGGTIGGCEICSAIGWRVDPISCPGHEGALCAPDPALGSPSVCPEERSFKWTRARDCLRFYIFFKQLLDLTGLDQTSVFLSKRQTLPAAACAPR